MDALLMCGGRGTRLDAETEKPLFEVGGKPMVASVADALAESRVETSYAAISPHAPETREYVAGRENASESVSLPTIETPGEGYVEDLQAALAEVESPVLTVAADLPLLAGDAVDSVLDAYVKKGEDASLTVCVPVALKRALGVSLDTTFERDGRELAPAGVNVVADTERDTMYETYDARFAVNVNRRSDADLAETLLGGDSDGPR